ncbi:MAG TPA: alpha/beta fold hydrolase [Thermoleophilaceae bacterium]|jgi:acetyl esterase/lipase
MVGHSATPTRSPGLRLIRDLLARPERHSYGGSRSQRADLYVPDGAGPHPVVVLLHGGYWRSKYGKSLMRAVSADLARRGFAAWNVEYRRMGRHGGGWPMTFDDVGAAIDLLPEIGRGRLRLDAVDVVGHSAGGQLAIWAATRRDGRVPVRRVVAQSAVCDMVWAGAAARELLGGGPDEVPERYVATNPMQLVPIGKPTLLVHGSDDETVPLERSRLYYEAARAAGDPVELIEPSPGHHRIHIDPRSRAWQVVAEWLAG